MSRVLEQSTATMQRNTAPRYFSALISVLACIVLVACPEITVDPTAGPQGAGEMVLDVYGTNTNFSQGQTTASFSRSDGASGIVVHQPIDVLSSEHLKLTISIPAGEPTGPQTLTVTTGAETADTTFDVTAKPYIDSLAPPRGEQGDVDLAITVTGVNTHFNSSTQPPEVDIAGVTVTSWNVVDDEHAVVFLDIAMDSPTGTHAGKFHVYSDYQVLSADFRIEEAVRWITIAPDEMEQSTTDKLVITGHKTAFLSSIDVEFDSPDGIEIVSVTPTSDLTADLELMVHSYAAPTLRTLRVIDPYGALEANFQVTEDLTPPSVTFNPGVAYSGNDTPVEAQGVNTSFLWPDTEVSWEPMDGNLTLSIVAVASSDRAQLMAEVVSGAAEQEYTVTLSTGAEHAVGTFWVMPEPSMTVFPVEEHQNESVLITVTGDNTHFDQFDTDVILASGSGLTYSNWQVTDPNSATFTLHVAPDAQTGPIQDAITLETPTPAGTETLSADFSVLDGYPVAELDPPGVEQGSQNYVVQAHGSYTHWSITGDTSVTLDPACQGFMTVHDVVVSSPTELTFQVDIVVLAPLRSCAIEILTNDGMIYEQIPSSLSIQSGAELVSTIPVDILGYVNGPQLYSVDLIQGQVLRARASCDPVLYLDPTLAIYAPGGDYTSSPLAENEDEHAATDDALIVYQAPEGGRYYLVVQDRLGFEVGPFTLSLDYYAPEGELEIEPNGWPTQESPAPMSSRLIRGGFAVADNTPDVFELIANVPGDWVAVQVIARSVSPYETSAADVILSLYNSAQVFQSTLEIGTESPDPVLYILASNLGFIELENDISGLLNTAYWINLRPQVVINEVHHDEANDWVAGFVELYGEPGMDLAGCHLLGKAHDTQENQLFDIDLTGHQLLSSGYLVIAHDDLVPGTGSNYIDDTLVISDHSSTYQSIGVVLTCNGTVLDTVCWRGAHLADCNTTFAPDDPGHLNIGRGYHIDTDDDAADFLPQPEPSPWNRNFREVW